MGVLWLHHAAKVSSHRTEAHHSVHGGKMGLWGTPASSELGMRKRIAFGMIAGPTERSTP